jgi:hypothetical protein
MTRELGWLTGRTAGATLAPALLPVLPTWLLPENRYQN